MIKVGDTLPDVRLFEFIEEATEGCAVGPNAFPVRERCAGKRVVILGMAPTSNAECEQQGEGFRYSLRDKDHRGITYAMEGSVSPEALEKRLYGSGMLVHMTKGKGEVVTAGTCEWIMGLKRNDFFTTRITRNVLDRFTREEPVRFSCAQIEYRRVQRALDFTTLEPAVGERGILVGAGVVDRVELAVAGVEHRDRWVEGETAGTSAGKIGERADVDHRESPEALCETWCTTRNRVRCQTGNVKGRRALKNDRNLAVRSGSGSAGAGRLCYGQWAAGT